ncbi:MAG: hypothetical protein R3E39_01800 [Anaerolineae bacterium]
MLVRAYRLTDKLGVVILKSAAVFSQHTLEGFRRITGVGPQQAGGIWGLLSAIVGAVIGLMWRILRTILGGVRSIFRFVFQLAGVTTRQAVGSVESGASGVMARRAARAELKANIAEDPLRAQNRVLSILFLSVLAALIVVVLWATNPARQGLNLPIGESISLLNADATTNPTSLPSLGSTLVPTATELPRSLEARGSIVYVARDNGQDDIFTVGIGGRAAIRLTNSPTDERDPAWSPDGQRLAYASRQDGNWEIYIDDLDLSTPPTRMTYDQSFQGNPQWSPDGLFIVYESYQGDNLDIYVVPVDGSQPAQRVTSNPAPDFSPSWSPDGRHIAFVSWRDGNQDIYIFSLDNPTDEASVNLTNTPERQENNPTWSPDGKYLAYSALDEGIEKVFVKSGIDSRAEAQVLARGRDPAWSPDGASLIYAVDSQEGTQFVAAPFSENSVATLVIGTSGTASNPVWTGRPLPTSLVNSGGLPSGVPQNLYVEQVSSPDQNGLYGLGTLVNIEVSRSKPYLSDKVNDSFNALRRRMLEKVGWDFLGKLDDAFWDLNRLPDAGEESRNWYRTGRAFGITRNLIAGFPSQIEVVREDIGINTFWRLYVRVSEDAVPGELGEPLRQMPWDMLSRNSGDVQAYDEGGRLKSQVPSGYYVDFTSLAEDYGWLRATARSDWRANVNSINYWLFEKIDGLSWYDAMRELYTDSQLGGFAATATPSPNTGQP